MGSNGCVYVSRFNISLLSDLHAGGRETWSLAALDEHLYVGTWQYGEGGQVYRLDNVQK